MLMKKIAYILAGMAFSAWISGCGTNEIVTQDIGSTYRAALCEGYKDSLLLEISLERPVSGLPAVAMENIHKDLVSSIFGKEYTSQDIETAIGLYQQSETEDYRTNCNSFKEMIRQEGEEPVEGLFTWIKTIDGEFLPPYKNMQSFQLSTYGYTGGAHGIDSEKGMTFDLSSGRLITENDLFIREYKPELSRILTAHLQESVSEDIYESLFIKAIEPNGNFVIAPEGMTYIYNRYEIGPYVSGIVRVTVPWEELEGLMR